MTGVSRRSEKTTNAGGGGISAVSAPYGRSEKETHKRLGLPDDFYERIKGRLHRRICRELRSAKRLLDIGCGACELDRFIAEHLVPGPEGTY
jgi:hypothetical protein